MFTRVLITGINGTIGRHVATALLAQGCYVIRGVGLEPDCAIRHDDLSFAQLDLEDSQAVEQLVREYRPEIVLHFAARVHVRDPNLTFSDYSRANYRASEVLFRSALTAGAKCLVFASSVEVYGPAEGDEPVAEEHPCRPESDYARSKLLAEESIRSLAESHGAAHAVLRLAPVYGPQFRLNLDKRLYLQTPPVGYRFGAGNYRLHFCSLKNIDHFLTQWLRSPKPESGTFNLADPKAYTVREIFDFERQHGRDRNVLPLPKLPCLALLSLRQTLLNAVGKDPGMHTAGNFRKLMRGAIWDTRKAERVAGELPGNLASDLYEASSCGSGSRPLSSDLPQDIFYERTKRAMDLIGAGAALGAFAVPLAVAAVAVRLTSDGPVLYWSRRIGRNNCEFSMPKLRTMRIDTPQVATHLLSNSESFVTPVGRLLRKTSIDELPQLWSILTGEMSFVGPRPALYNQDDLVRLRTERAVHTIVPGLTGWAQINGRDELPIPVKVDYDVHYLHHRSLRFDLQIILKTFLKVAVAEGVNH